MAIVDAALIAAVRAEIDAEFGAIPPGLQGDADGYRQKLARCIAKAAQYVRDNAELNVVVTSVTAVTPGSGASGPGTGTGTLI